MNDRWMAPAPMLGALMRRLQRVLAPPAKAYVPLRVEGRAVGWLTAERAQRLAGWPAYFRVWPDRVDCVPSLATHAARTAAFAEVARALAAEGALTAWRDERYAVAAQPGGAPEFELERAAARYFGVHTFAAHLNAVVGSEEDWQMWLARRSPVKPIDPGLLDNLVAGGVSSGQDAWQTLLRESGEEAGIPVALAQRSRPAAVFHVCRDVPEGLDSEILYVYDLALGADFAPRNTDGEVSEFLSLDTQALLERIARGEMTVEAALVAAEFLLRRGLLQDQDGKIGAAVQACRGPISP